MAVMSFLEINNTGGNKSHAQAWLLLNYSCLFAADMV